MARTPAKLSESRTRKAVEHDSVLLWDETCGVGGAYISAMLIVPRSRAESSKEE